MKEYYQINILNKKLSFSLRLFFTIRIWFENKKYRRYETLWMVVKLSVVSDLMRNKIQTCLTHSGHIYTGLYTDLNWVRIYISTQFPGGPELL